MSNLKLKRKSIASNIKPEWEELCEICSTMAKSVNWTKEDSRKLLKQVRKEIKEVSEDGTGSRHPLLGDVGMSTYLNFLDNKEDRN